MIKNIIFDLGGVIVHLNDLSSPVSRFQQLGFTDVSDYLTLYGQKDFIMRLENGEIDEMEFVRILAEKCNNPSLTYDDAKWAWMGFIGETEQKNLDFLLLLKEKYNVCLLSNTSGFIMDWAHSCDFSPAGKPIDDYFHTIYTSYELKDYKPSLSIFRKMIDKEGINPDETLFLDDGKKNIEAAQMLGIHTLHVGKDEDLIPALMERLTQY